MPGAVGNVLPVAVIVVVVATVKVEESCGNGRNGDKGKETGAVDVYFFCEWAVVVSLYCEETRFM